MCMNEYKCEFLSAFTNAFSSTVVVADVNISVSVDNHVCIYTCVASITTKYIKISPSLAWLRSSTVNILFFCLTHTYTDNLQCTFYQFQSLMPCHTLILLNFLISLSWPSLFTFQLTISLLQWQQSTSTGILATIILLYSMCLNIYFVLLRHMFSLREHVTSINLRVLFL